MVLMALLLALQGVTMSNPDASHSAHHAAAKIPVECGAFKANANGSWTSTRRTKVGSVAMSAGGTFFPGVTLNGVDVAGQLDQQCRSPRAQ